MFGQGVYKINRGKSKKGYFSFGLSLTAKIGRFRRHFIIPAPFFRQQAVCSCERVWYSEAAEFNPGKDTKMYKVFRWVLTSLFLIAATTLFSEQNTPYRNLVFEGVGVRGIAYCGALAVLEERGILENIVRVAGTSSGAIPAAMLALGYSVEEMNEILLNTNFGKFNDGNWVFFGGMFQFAKYYGLHKGIRLERWFESLIEAKTESGNITFRELHELAESSMRYKDLYVTGTNLSIKETVVFSYESYPDMKIRDALRISVSIPFYYRPIYMD